MNFKFLKSKLFYIILVLLICGIFIFFYINHIQRIDDYYHKYLIVYNFKNYEDSAKLDSDELYGLNKKVIESLKIDDVSHPFYIMTLCLSYSGIIKDKYGRYSYYYNGELKRNGLYKIKGYKGKWKFSDIYIDENGYLVKNYYLQDFVYNSRKRSFYINNEYQVVADTDIQFDNNIKSNKVISNKSDIYHFGVNKYLTKRTHVNEKGDTVIINGKWQRNEDNIWQYYNVNGYIEKDSIIVNDNTYFYVDNNGLLVKNYYLQNFFDGKEYHDYYFNKNGAMIIWKGPQVGRESIYIDKNTNSNKDIDGPYLLYIDTKTGHVTNKVKTEQRDDKKINQELTEIDTEETLENVDIEQNETEDLFDTSSSIVIYANSNTKNNQLSDPMFSFLFEERDKDLNGLKEPTYLTTEKGEPTISKPSDFVGILAKVFLDIDNDKTTDLLLFEIETDKKIYMKLYKEQESNIKLICKQELETPGFTNYLFYQKVYIKKVENEYRIFVELYDTSNYSVSRQYVNNTYYVYNNNKFIANYISGYDGGSADYYRANEFYEDFISSGLELENFDTKLLESEEDYENIDYYLYDRNLIKIYEFERNYDGEISDEEGNLYPKNYFTTVKSYNDNGQYIYIE